MNNNRSIFKLLALSLIVSLVFVCCKKDAQTNALDTSNWEKTNSLTKIYILSDSTEGRLTSSPTNKTLSIISAGALSYSIVSGCKANTLNLNIAYNGAPPNIFAGPSSPTVKLNGVSFGLTYTGLVGTRFNYTLSNVSLSSIGISNFCLYTGINAQYYSGTTLISSETLSINEGSSCGSGSYQCSASSPGKGKLSLYLPYLSCSCDNMYPTIYTFGYRLHGTTVWTNVPVTYPGYFTANTITGLASGTYDIQGQNTCTAYWSAPAVPAIQTTVTIP